MAHNRNYKENDLPHQLIDRERALSRPLASRSVVAAIFFFLIKPACLSVCFPLLSTVYNCLTIFVAAYLLVVSVARLRISPLTLFVVFFQGYYLLNTYLHHGDFSAALFYFLRVVALCLLVELGVGNKSKALIDGGSLFFLVIAIANFATVIAFPDGMYLSSETGNACYFLGHRNMLFRILVPGLLLSYLHDYFDSGTIRHRTFFYLGVLVATDIAVWSASSLVSLAVTVLVFFAFSSFRGLCRHGVAVSAGAGIVGSISLIVFHFQEKMSYLIVDVLQKDLTLSTRTFVWERALRIIEWSPWTGYGLEHSSIAQLRFITVTSSHNFFLDQLYFGGAIAVAFLLLGLALIGRSLRRCPDKNIISAIATCLTALFVTGIVEPMGFGLSLLIVPFALAYHAKKLCINVDKEAVAENEC